jgi:DNA ligase-1
MELELQLARRWDQVKKEKVKFPVLIEIKFDGIRALIFKKGGRQKVVTRYGHVIPFELFDIPDGIYDCEVWKPGKNFDTASGEIRKGDLRGAVIEVFDYLTWDEWKSRETPPLKERRARLEKIKFEKPLTITDAWIGETPEDVEKAFKIAVKKGMEGIMIKELDSKYVWGRGGGWYKYKKIDYEDAEIIGFEEGTGRLEGSLGALIVRLKDGRTTKVGTGFTDEERAEIWKNKKKYIGKWIEVAFQEKAKKALRMPRFVRFKL